MRAVGYRTTACRNGRCFRRRLSSTIVFFWCSDDHWPLLGAFFLLAARIFFLRLHVRNHIISTKVNVVVVARNHHRCYIGKRNRKRAVCAGFSLILCACCCGRRVFIKSSARNTYRLSVVYPRSAYVNLFLIRRGGVEISLACVLVLHDVRDGCYLFTFVNSIYRND